MEEGCSFVVPAFYVTVTAEAAGVGAAYAESGVGLRAVSSDAVGVDAGSGVVVAAVQSVSPAFYFPV